MFTAKNFTFIFVTLVNEILQNNPVFDNGIGIQQWVFYLKSL